MRREKSIAVLPFVSLSPNKEDEYFCDGITEEIINSLAKVNDVYVTSRTSSFHFKKAQTHVTEIAQKLGVRFIVEGSARMSGDNVRVTVQLINADEDYHYWSQNFDYKMDNIFEIQDDIGRCVQEKFRELIGHFTIDDLPVNAKKGSLKAYELILRAKQHATDLSGEGIQLGLELIDEALKLEPENPQFLATKATYISALGIMGAWPLQVASQLALKVCDYALKIEPENPEAHAIKGHLSFVISGDLDKFYFHLDKSLSIRPKDPVPLYFLSIVESALGNYERSMDAIETAFELNPLSQLPYYFRAINLMRLRHYDDALDEVKAFLRNYPNHINAYNVQGLIYLRLGKAKLALAHFCKMPGADGRKVPFYGGMAMAFALMGNISQSEEYLRLSKLHDSELKLSYCENPSVLANFLLGRFEEGFKELESDLHQGKWYLRFYRTNPFFDPILADPRSKMLEKALINLDKVNQPEAPKYAKSGLTDEEINAIENRLTEYISKQKPYLDQDLSLKSLAKALDISANHLSQVINSQSNKNFFDYINSFRIKELLEKLTDPDNKKFTILSLAYESGFNSKSTFNASFKKLTGITPTEYVKSVEAFSE